MLVFVFPAGLYKDLSRGGAASSKVNAAGWFPPPFLLILIIFSELIDFFFFFAVVQATAEANNLTAVAGAKDLYSKNMEKVRRGGVPPNRPFWTSTVLFQT